MLTKRIIPTILMNRRQLVQGKKFKPDRVVGNVMQAARIHAARSVDEILMLDVMATAEGREPDYGMIKALTQTAFIPVTVGGGVMAVEHARRLMDSGADKIAVGAYKHKLIHDLSNRFGRQAVVVTVPVFNLEETGMACLQAQADGAGEIVLQSVSREGTMEGYDHDMIERGALSCSVPVVASGGCKSYADMEIALQAGADAVAAGSLYLFTGATPRGAAEYLNKAGMEVRLCG